MEFGLNLTPNVVTKKTALGLVIFFKCMLKYHEIKFKKYNKSVFIGIFNEHRFQLIFTLAEIKF